MLQKFKRGTDVQAMEQVARNALLLTVEGDDLEDASKLADAAVTLGCQIDPWPRVR